MAVLNATQLAEHRRFFLDTLAKDNTAPPAVVKAQYSAAFQSIEDWLELAATKQEVSNRINTATAPTVLSAELKRRLFAICCFWKFRREGVL